jgi:hypothetical protein
VEDLPRMDRNETPLLHRHDETPLVIIDDLDVERVSCVPDEADAPLVIDPDAVLSATVPLEDLEPVPGWAPQV